MGLALARESGRDFRCRSNWPTSTPSCRATIYRAAGRAIAQTTLSDANDSPPDQLTCSGYQAISFASQTCAAAFHPSSRFTNSALARRRFIQLVRLQPVLRHASRDNRRRPAHRCRARIRTRSTPAFPIARHPRPSSLCARDFRDSAVQPDEAGRDTSSGCSMLRTATGRRAVQSSRLAESNRSQAAAAIPATSMRCCIGKRFAFVELGESLRRLQPASVQDFAKCRCADSVAGDFGCCRFSGFVSADAIDRCRVGRLSVSPACAAPAPKSSIVRPQSPARCPSRRAIYTKAS